MSGCLLSVLDPAEKSLDPFIAAGRWTPIHVTDGDPLAFQIVGKRGDPHIDHLDGLVEKTADRGTAFSHATSR